MNYKWKCFLFGWEWKSWIISAGYAGKAGYKNVYIHKIIQKNIGYKNKCKIKDYVFVVKFSITAIGKMRKNRRTTKAFMAAEVPT